MSDKAKIASTIISLNSVDVVYFLVWSRIHNNTMETSALTAESFALNIAISVKTPRNIHNKVVNIIDE